MRDSRPVNLAVIPLLAVLSACGGDDSIVGPVVGAVAVEIASDGGSGDPGYTVQLDEQDAVTLTGGIPLVIQDVAAGSHTITLGVTPGCSVAPTNPRTVSVTAGDTTRVTFQVTCAVSVGSLSVTTVTTGESADPDGYLLLITGNASRPIPANATTTIDGLSAGTHTLTLTKLATNCAQTAGQTSVTIEPGESQAITLAVDCTFIGAVQWDTIPLPGPPIGPISATGIWGTSPTDLFVVGARTSDGAGIILHYDGSGWTEQARLQDTTLAAVAGASPSDVWAVGNVGTTRGVVLHYDGAEWTRSDGPAPEAVLTKFDDVVVTPDGSVLLSGKALQTLAESDTLSELLARNDGAGWSRLETPGFGAWAELGSVAAGEGGKIWVSGEHFNLCDDCQDPHVVLAMFDGSQWSLLSNPQMYGLAAVAAVGPSEAWAVGRVDDSVGQVVHIENGSVTVSLPVDGLQVELADVWGSGRDDVYAVNREALLHSDGNTWSRLATIGGKRVWGLSRHDVFVLQDGRLIHGQ